MEKPSIFMKKKLLFVLFSIQLFVLVLIGRVIYIQTVKADELQKMAYEQQTRDRLISPDRGSILDRNGTGIAVTETVNAISVIPAQIKDKDYVSNYLSEVLEMEYDEVFEKVNQKVALVRIKTKVDSEIAMEIRKKDIEGIVVDEDVKRIYPYSNIASQVIGFVGKDNQGIIGLEAKYDEYLKGEEGKILTLTDSKGLEVDSTQERIAPIDGYNLVTSIDIIIQQYAEQTIKKAVESKKAQKGIIIVLNPQNGEIYAMANYPNFDLNNPFVINDSELLSIWDTLSEKEQNDALNQMWRNTAINDTYEPGSTFKTVTSAASLEEGVVTPESTFFCNGYHIAGDRMIKCWRYPRTHGAQTFVQGVQNSCNPVFMELGERLGAEKFYEYMDKFGFNEKTGIDLSGEAVGIMHKLENVGPVELATMSFGQSFQITPLQLLRAVSSMVNGGYLITPHIGCKITDNEGNVIKELEYGENEKILSDKTSEQMKVILESVVSEGTGNKAYIPGYRIGGKTATSEKLPRRSGKYIASFLTFAPAENPQVMAIVLIDEPQGTYYGGTVAGPVMQELLLNILPYMGIEPVYSEKEKELPETVKNTVPDISNLSLADAKNILKESNIEFEIQGEGENVTKQFPPAGETINIDSKVIIYTQ
ncbi:peptidoglycan glycosyltransferase [Tyzzerella sp. An114]|uniref:penicillin-binding transpeptidase domain-containing protein n=1 Tax=Tyzzerella sp. An114 TaxID=1965545 RepID=UPI000B44CEF5|nr:penicillin-binding transpeptidase domain-containing protein [Tyzzerella sp. An114]OUQ59928.1 peptidoglycan glycosyltransferase [Tyzzerella sp. An114]